MRVGSRDTDRAVVIVAEIGNNHEGDERVAGRLVEAAAASGVDGVKFQTFRTEHYVGQSDKARFERLKHFELPYAAFERLAAHARARGLLFLSTPFDLESARFLTGIVDALKIASGDNTFWPLIELAARSDRPLIVSGGLATLAELRRVRDVVASARGSNSDLAVLHCVSSYPAPAEEANLRAIPTLVSALGCTIGYSDHTLGADVALAAVALGARIVEKHFTLDKQYSEFRDHKISADPEEMRNLVERIRQLETALGSGLKAAQRSEIDGLTTFRRSIVAAADLRVGHTLTMADLTWVRPAGGLPPGSESRVVGRRLRRDVRAGERLTDDLVVEA